MNLEQRLKQGPLPIRALWSEEQTLGIDENVRRIGRRRRRINGALALTVVCAGLLFFRFQQSESVTAPRAVAVETLNTERATEQAFTALSEPRQRLILTDGSRVTLAAGTSFKVLSQDPKTIVCDFSDGASVWEVTPNPERRFEVRAGDVTVSVLGTVFRLERSQGRTQVFVERGVVNVRWPGGAQDLRAGSQGVFPPVAAASAPAITAVPEPAGNALPKDSEVSWRNLARAGNYQEAYRAFQGEPVAGVEDLMLAADVARLSGHPAEAVSHLRRVHREFPKNAQAPLAAFTLGRIFADQLGQPGSAAEAFRAAYTLSPSGPLASDAMAREVESLARSGNSLQAAERAGRYLELYPQGRHSAEMKRIRAQH